ncbi:MAG: hypothetical protein ACKJRS_07380 [Woeseiaceae bacterium]
MKNLNFFIRVITLLIPCCILQANEFDFEGRWILSLQDKKRTLIGLLEIEKNDQAWVAYLEGGPVEINIKQNQIEILADSRDVRGFVFNRRLTGFLVNNQIQGRYQQEGAAAQKEEPGPWSAVRDRKHKSSTNLPKIPKPEEISGIWTATQELDFRKYSMSLTQEGKDWLEQYLPYYDQPDVRCTSIGLPALVTYSFPFEIIFSNGRYTFLYEYQSKVRRIWANTESPGSFMPPSRMGFSKGVWEGNELVIKTQLLEKTVRDFRGELISENAIIEERYSLSEDGQTLTALIIVDDPDNYQRKPIRRRQWVRNASTEIFPYSCDPDSFYIPMYQDGEMQMYIDRSPLRF